MDEREREREQEEGAESSKEKARRESKANYVPEVVQSVEGDRLHALVERAEPLIEQLNNLYASYIAGVDKIPPTERRKQLDQTMTALQLSAKPTRALAFRIDGLQSKYISYRDRWDKLMKDLESGKIKRRPGQK